MNCSAISSVNPIYERLTSDDWLANYYIKRHRGVYEPEVRLWMIWISSTCMIGGLILLGFALEDLLPWIVTAVAWGIYVFGAVLSIMKWLILAYGNCSSNGLQSRYIS